MKINKRSLIALSVVAALSGCSDDDTKYVPVDSGFSPVVTQGKTLTNTPDVVVKSQNEVEIGEELTVTIGATSDLHGRIFGYDYAMDAVDSDAGLTRISTLLNVEKANNPNMILVDIGDTVQGNSAQLFNDEPTHPVVQTLNAMAFDVWVPGNHEFNFERSFIDRNLEHFNGAVISSNIKWEENNANYLRGFQVFEVDGAKVAIVAVTPANVPNWEASAPSHFAGLKFDDELASTRAAVEELVAEHQPDVVVGTFHLGRGVTPGGAGVHKIAGELADTFDVILAGHEHATYIETVAKGDDKGVDISVDGKGGAEDPVAAGEYTEANRAESVKIMEPGKWGSALAKAEITLKKTDTGWEMMGTELTNISTKDVSEDQALASQFQYVDDASKDDARTVIGTVSGNFIDVPGNPTGGEDEATHEAVNGETERLYTTIHASKVHDTALVDLINQIQISKTDAQVSAAALFSDYSNLVDGQQYAKKDSTNLYKYDNTLLGVNMTGAKIKEFMEWSYDYFDTYTPGDITIGFNAAVKSYNYDQFDGDFSYEVDLTEDAGNRITILEIGGEAFDETKTYKVAVNSYRFGSQVVPNGWATDADVYYDSVNEPVYAIRDMLTEYVAENGVLDVNDFQNKNWSFKQYQNDGAIALERSSNVAGTTGSTGAELWQMLQDKEICVVVEGDNPRYAAIGKAVNVNDDSTFFVNPTPGIDTGCIAE